MDNTLNIYLLPGMGADERLFERMDIQFGTLNHLRWEFIEGCVTLSDYATVLCERITTENNVLIGSSMGGMMAVEMYRIGTFDDLILLSAPSSSLEFPPVLKTFGRLNAGKWFGKETLFKLNRAANLFMGFQDAEHEKLFYEMLEGYGPDFLKYAVNAILKWDNTNPPEEYLQIIGSKDRLFRRKRMPKAIVLEGSGHFMTFEQPVEITKLVNARLEALTRLLRDSK
ncbi:MAG: alpha/beta hydrolase [Flavobacteriales bacterium]|nr:alpha/beta hydrolase [Flavobacteriales bacterium]